MKTPYKKLSAAISAFLAIAVAVQSAPAVFADNSEKEPEVSVAIPVYGEPSVYGEQDVYYIDENGEEVTFDLIPERYEQYDYDRALPVSYNLVDDGFVSSVKNQGSTGTCWAHSALAAAESSLIKDGLADKDIDFSEAHLVWFSQGQGAPADSPLYGESLGIGSKCYDNGGNIYISIGALSAWVGAANESDYANVTARPSLDESMRFDSEYHLQNAVIFDSSDRQSIKSYLMDNGALTISYHTDDKNDSNHYKYADEYTSFYQNDYTTTNHAVTIVGWDDTFSKDNFIVTPPDDGAWIIKNSWGTYFGTDGYFYLSYYDTSIKSIASYELERNTNYGKVYQHSMYATPGICYTNNSITGANVFTASADDNLAAVAFFTSDASVPYTISIYEGVSETNPMSGTLLHTQSGTAAYAGYHTIDLDKTVSVHNGSRFSVCVALDKAGTRMALDRKAINSGDSFFTYGVGTSSSYWNDVMDGNYQYNMVIRAFTVSNAPVVKAPALPKFSASAGDKQVTLTWSSVENAEKYKVMYRLNGTTAWTEKETTATSYTVTGLTNGKKYDFLVLAGNASGWSQWTSSDIVNAIAADTTLVNNFVERLYTKMLNRASEAEGKDYWTECLLKGDTAASVAENFVLGDEVKNSKLTNQEFVTRLYRTFMDREPDAGGLKYWTDILDNGCSYAYAFSNFVQSEEFKNICNSFGITPGYYECREYRDKSPNLTAFVSRMYTKAFGRGYDVDGLNYWTKVYITKESTLDKIAECFIFSEEFERRKLNDEQFVDCMYASFFDRPGDAGGKAYWLQFIADGGSRRQVFTGFVTAEEYRKLVNSFGLGS